MASIIAFVQEHKDFAGAALVALLDLIFALNKNAKSSGILHWIYVTLGGKNY